jgi:hypothetical protein
MRYHGAHEAPPLIDRQLLLHVQPFKLVLDEKVLNDLPVCRSIYFPRIVRGLGLLGLLAIRGPGRVKAVAHVLDCQHATPAGSTSGSPFFIHIPHAPAPWRVAALFFAAALQPRSQRRSRVG